MGAGVLTLALSCRYQTMCRCWALDPGSRPPFSELVSFMCHQLTDREEKVGCFPPARPAGLVPLSRPDTSLPPSALLQLAGAGQLRLRQRAGRDGHPRAGDAEQDPGGRRILSSRDGADA